MDEAEHRVAALSAHVRAARVDMHLHQLRHYSATELISAGMDPRTVAGRLGHGGGGSTTLRVYSAWVSEADQKAAGAENLRMPAPPFPLDLPAPSAVRTATDSEPSSPYKHIAAGRGPAVLRHPARVHHVGIATGNGILMINALRRATVIRIQDVATFPDYPAASRPSTGA